MSIAVLEKAFTVIEAMEQLGVPVPLRRIAEVTGMPKATVYRIVHSLVTLGYMAQDRASGDYQLTMKLAQLGRVNRYDGLVARALPYMEELLAKFNETTNLGVLEDDRVYYLHSLETSKALRWIVKPERSDAFHCTALGRAYAAFLDEDRVRLLLARSRFEPRTSKSPRSAAAVRAILSEVREAGWALDDEDNDVGVVCLAIPLLEDGMPVASISVSVPKGRMTEQLRSRMISALVDVKDRWTSEKAAPA